MSDTKMKKKKRPGTRSVIETQYRQHEIGKFFMEQMQTQHPRGLKPYIAAGLVTTEKYGLKSIGMAEKYHGIYKKHKEWTALWMVETGIDWKDFELPDNFDPILPEGSFW